MKKMFKALLLCVAFAGAPALAAVDINTATQSELESVKGLGPAKAKAIIMYREANGRFASVDDLDKVKGIGKATIDKMRGDLVVAPAAGEQASSGR